MHIKQFKYSTDNLGYLVYSTTQGIVIDAGAVDKILAFAQSNNISIKYITNTHSHYDHTQWNKDILEKTNAQFIDSTKIKSEQTIHLDHEILKVIYTPGHTDDSITFHADDFLITGDTLFNGTVGNCFSGNLDAFFLSLKQLISFPKSTKIYSGHDYVKESLQFALGIEKDNFSIQEYQNKYNPALIVSTIEDELKVNPFLRFNAPSTIKDLQQKKMPFDSELARFKSIMEVY